MPDITSDNGVLLFNPRAVAKGSPNYRIPNSILQIAASIEGLHEYIIVDGNREQHAVERIENLLTNEPLSYLAVTVMPGPQLKQAIRVSQVTREKFPEIIIIWGGYFASNQADTVIRSPLVDFVIHGPGDSAFPLLLDALKAGMPYEFIQNLVYLDGSEVIRTPREMLIDQDELPDLPYHRLNQFYPLEGYLKQTHLGTRTAAYHSSMGCPFRCSFCAVVPIFEARWKGKSAERIYKDIKFLKEAYGANAIEFHDNNFFVSEDRVRRFSELVLEEDIHWWGEGRIDTIDKYRDDTLKLMYQAGCRMIFFGAESGNDTLLQEIDKGGRQSGEQIKQFAARLRPFKIVPEYSFVLGFPADSPEQVRIQIEDEIQFIREIKSINPDTEIIIYIYSPVPTEGSELFKRIQEAGFSFPSTLEEWLSPAWENFDLRRNPLTPWLTPEMIRRIRDFETVLNAYYPTATDLKLTGFQKSIMRLVANFRYRLDFCRFPVELKFLQKYWLKYRQPEWEGF